MTLPDVIQRYLDAYNRKDVAALIACVDDKVVFENVSNTNGTLRIDGRTAFTELAEKAAVIFQSRHQTVRTAVISGDQVALEIEWTGTPAIDLGPMKAGEQTSMRGASFFTVKEDRIAKIVDLS